MAYSTSQFGNTSFYEIAKKKSINAVVLILFILFGFLVTWVMYVAIRKTRDITSHSVLSAQSKEFTEGVPDFEQHVTISGAKKNIKAPNTVTTSERKLPMYPLPTGSKKFIVIVCNTSGETKNWYETIMLTNKYPSMNHFWQEVSYGKIDLNGSRILENVSAQLPNPQEEGWTVQDVVDKCLDAANEQYTDLYVPDYYGIIVFASHTPIAGGIYTDLTIDGVTQDYGVATMKSGPWVGDKSGHRNHATLAHEMGHALGLKHSFLYWDVMSYATSSYYSLLEDPVYNAIGQHTNSNFKDVLGWIPPERKLIVKQHEELFELKSLEMMPKSDYIMAEIPIKGSKDYYILETHKSVGYDKTNNRVGVAVGVVHGDMPINTASNTYRVVQVGNTCTKRGSCGGFDNAILIPGEDFTDSTHGIKVEVVSETTEGYMVRITTPVFLTAINYNGMYNVPGSKHNYYIKLTNTRSKKLYSVTLDTRVPEGFVMDLQNCTAIVRGIKGSCNMENGNLTGADLDPGNSVEFIVPVNVSKIVQLDPVTCDNATANRGVLFIPRTQTTPLEQKTVLTCIVSPLKVTTQYDGGTGDNITASAKISNLSPAYNLSGVTKLVFTVPQNLSFENTQAVISCTWGTSNCAITSYNKSKNQYEMSVSGLEPSGVITLTFNRIRTTTTGRTGESTFTATIQQEGVCQGTNCSSTVSVRSGIR